MKKILSTILTIGIVLSNVNVVKTVAVAQTDTDKMKIYEPVIDYDTGTVTVGGYVDDFVYNKYDPLSINLIVTEADVNYSDLKQSLDGLVYMNEIPVSEDGSFECKYSDLLTSGKQAEARNVYLTNPFSGEKDNLYYVIANGESFADVLNARLLFSVQSPVYYINGQLNEASKAPYIENGEILIPKEILEQAQIQYSGNSEYVNLSTVTDDKYISDSTGLVVIGKGDCKDYDNTIAGTMFGVYVSPNGNDNNSGSALKPVKSIEKAIEISEKKSIVHKTVYLHGGTYRTEDTILLDSENENLTIKAYCTEKVKFTRDTFISADKFELVKDFDGLNFPESVKGKLMVADLGYLNLDSITDCTDHDGGLPLDAEKKYYYQVYQNDVLQTLARYPNGEKNERFNSSSEPGGFDDVEKLALWGNAENAYLYSYGSSGYDISRNRITGTDVENKKMNFDGTSTRAYANGDFFVYNIPEELDTAGEWYIDDFGKLYYYPLNGFTGIDFVSNENPFIKIINTKGISIEDIDFEYTRSSSIVAKNVSDILIDNITIHGVSGTGIHMMQAKNIKVQNCELYDIGTAGIFLMQGQVLNGEKDITKPADFIIRNNHIYDYSNWKSTQKPGIFVSGVGTEIANNTVHGSNHLGIMVYGCDVNIHHNDVYEVVRETADAGGIYCGGTYDQRGIVIDSNFLHDMYDYVFPFYCDDIISGVEVTNNIIKDNRYTGQFSSGRDNTFSGNMIINSGYLNYTNDATGVGGWRSPSKEQIQASILDKIEDGTIDEMLWREKYRGFGEFLDEIRNSKESDFHELTFNGVSKVYYKTLGIPKNFIYKDNVFVKTDDYERRENWFDVEYKTNKNVKHLASGLSGKLEEYADEMQTETLVNKMPEYSLTNIGSTLTSTVTPVQAVYPQNGDTVNDGKFTMVWNNAHGITKYKVTISDNKDFTNSIVDKTVYNNFLDVELNDGVYYAKITAIDERRQCFDTTETLLTFAVGEEKLERTVRENDDGSLTVTISSTYKNDKAVDVIAAGKTSLGVLKEAKIIPAIISFGKEWSQNITVSGEVKEIYVWEPNCPTPVFDKWDNQK